MNRNSNIPEGYRCPFCPDHQDNDFGWSELAETFICGGCYHEIYQGLDFDHQPSIDEINCADTIDKLLVRLGISYEDLQQRQKRLVVSR